MDDDTRLPPPSRMREDVALPPGSSIISDDFAAMTLEARSWFFYRRQNKIYSLINTLVGNDPNAGEVPWAEQVELAEMIRDARDRRKETSRRRERRVSTLTSVVRTVLGGLLAAGALKVISFIWAAPTVAAITSSLGRHGS